MISKDQTFPDVEIRGLYGSGSPYYINGPRVHEFLQEMNREDSVRSYYKKLIQLRKEYEIVVYGDYQGVDRDNERVFHTNGSWEKRNCW